MRILALSDIVLPFIYGPSVRKRFGEVDVIIGCGDMPYYYLEYVLSVLNVPLFFVRGNHDKEIEYSSGAPRKAPAGGMDLHRQVIRHQKLLLAGIEGSGRYRPGPYQYSQNQMWLNVFGLVPALLFNRARYGRYLDVFVSHAPPQGIHDVDDLPHQGIKAYRWLLDVFKPAFHLHGHTHVYRPDTIVETQYGATKVFNVFGFKEFQIPQV